MVARLDQGFVRLESQKTATLTRLSGYSAAQVVASPQTGSWSALSVVEHLQRSEQAIVQVVSANLRNPRRVTARDWCGAVFIINLFLLPVRVRVPNSVAQIVPGVAVNLGEVVEGWNATRRELMVLLEGFPVEAMGQGVFRHPVGGWMTIGHTLRFLSAHVIHHGHQLRRLELGFGG
jgi:hypothetical protein